MAGQNREQVLSEYEGRDQSTRRVVRVICVLNESVLVVKRQKNGEEYWVLPGGGADPDEDLAAAAKRETVEETQVAVEVGEPLLVIDANIEKDYPETHIFSSSYVSGHPHLDPEGEEAQRTTANNTYEPMWLPIAEARAKAVPAQARQFI